MSINETLRRKEHLTTNWDYRVYLQRNATAVMEFDVRTAAAQCANFPSFTPDMHSQPPYLYGVSPGQPYFYELSDLKANYLKK
jgi:hypothetical protein